VADRSKNCVRIPFFFLLKTSMVMAILNIYQWCGPVALAKLKVGLNFGMQLLSKIVNHTQARHISATYRITITPVPIVPSFPHSPGMRLYPNPRVVIASSPGHSPSRRVA